MYHAFNCLRTTYTVSLKILTWAFGKEKEDCKTIADHWLFCTKEYSYDWVYNLINIYTSTYLIWIYKLQADFWYVNLPSYSWIPVVLISLYNRFSIL